MITFKKQVAQGDMLITRIDALPLDVKPIEPENGVYVCAHSETGHNHVVQAENVFAYEAANDPFIMYMVVERPTVLKHLRSFDTHAPIKIPLGTYRINRQREWVSDGFRRAAD